MAQKVRRHPFGQTGELGTAGEWPPNIGTAEARLAGLRHTETPMERGGGSKIARAPLKRPPPAEKIDAGGDKGRLREDTHGAPGPPPAQLPETQPRHNNSAIGVVKPN